MRIAFSSKCAWRATYLYRTLDDGLGEHLFAFVSVDPTSDFGPRLTVSMTNPLRRASRSITLRVPLPHVRWRSNAGPLRRWCATQSSRFWHSVDGRYSSKASTR